LININHDVSVMRALKTGTVSTSDVKISCEDFDNFDKHRAVHLEYE